MELTNQSSLFPDQKGPGNYGNFYNTTNLSGEELKLKRLKAGSQEAIVLNFFTITPPYKFTAYEVFKALERQGEKMIKDSVKRAISNLSNPKKGGYLQRTKELKPGQYPGNKEHVYELINKPLKVKGL